LIRAAREHGARLEDPMALVWKRPDPKPFRGRRDVAGPVDEGESGGGRARVADLVPAE
jgi:hypothetical protein